MKPMVLMLSFVFLVGAVGCRRTDRATEKDLATPVVPEGFDEKSVASLKCPENGSALRLATKKELAEINDRIGGKKIKVWFDGSVRMEFVDAVLIRADGKIGYRLDGALPILRLEEALVLNDKVGPPDPQKNKK